MNQTTNYFPPGTAYSLNPFKGEFTDSHTRHLLRRTLFGVSKKDFTFYRGRNLQTAIDFLFTRPEFPTPPIINYTNGNDIKEPNGSDGQTWINLEWNDKIEYYRLLSLKTWWMDLMLEDQSINEKMIMFWHNHIPVEMVGVFHARQSYDYLTTIRKNALGNFRDLIKAITIEPLMLFYLNGNSNDKNAPDENYGRELQELFCVGKGPDSKYTEGDVKAAARVLTGWKSDFLKPKTYFAEWAHDSNDKQFSAFYNSKIIKGRSGQDGMNELDEFLDMILSNPECSKFICRKLYRSFVYPEISEEVEATIITPLAQLFKDSNFEIKPVLQKLLMSEHFFDTSLEFSVIKSPLDYSIGLNKHFNMNFPTGNLEQKNRFQAQTVMYYFLTSFQQDIGDPPNVSGWPAYYQFPQFDKSWISTHTIHQRGVHTDMLVYYGYQYFDKVARIDWVLYTNTYDRAYDPNFLIEDVLSTVLGVEVAPEVKGYLKAFLLSGQLSDYYWTAAWNSWRSNPFDQMTRNTVENRLKPFYQYILQLDEYQLY